MRARPPYGRGTRDGTVTVTADADDVMVVAVCGSWSRPLSREAFLALKKALSGHPAALVVDLSALDDPHATSAATWTTVRRVADAMEPPVQLVACVPPSSVLADRMRRLGSAYVLPMFADRDRARRAVATGRPLTQQVRLALPVDPDTPALARNLVTEACAAWRLSGVLYPGRLVMSELAGNAVEHARTPIVAVVTRRGTGLHLIVNDRDPRMPHLIESPTEPPGGMWDVRGQGLRNVRAAAAAWGALPTAEGKMVWATVRPR